MRALAGVPLLGWFSEGTADVSYGQFLQSTYYGRWGTPSTTDDGTGSLGGHAHVRQLGYSIPF
jgi:hypothetical protein